MNFVGCTKTCLDHDKRWRTHIFCEKQNYLACHSEPLLLIFAYSRTHLSASTSWILAYTERRGKLKKIEVNDFEENCRFWLFAVRNIIYFNLCNLLPFHKSFKMFFVYPTYCVCIIYIVFCILRLNAILKRICEKHMLSQCLCKVWCYPRLI